MRLGTMFQDILKSFFTKHDTQLYPVERIPPPERYRGILSYNPGVCTGCNLCVKDCPSDAIQLVIIDRAAKKYVMNYHMDRCVYCGQCVVNCKPRGISMSNQEWEHAALSKDFLVRFGNEEDIAAYMERLTPPAVEPTGS